MTGKAGRKQPGQWRLKPVPGTSDIMVDQEPEALGWNQGQTTICKAPPPVPVTHFLLLGPSSVSFPQSPGQYHHLGS